MTKLRNGHAPTNVRQTFIDALDAFRHWDEQKPEPKVIFLADWIGAVSVALRPMVEIIEAHVLSAQRLHVNDTPVPVVAKAKTKTGRL